MHCRCAQRPARHCDSEAASGRLSPVAASKLRGRKRANTLAPVRLARRRYGLPLDGGSMPGMPTRSCSASATMPSGRRQAGRDQSSCCISPMSSTPWARMRATTASMSSVPGHDATQSPACSPVRPQDQNLHTHVGQARLCPPARRYGCRNTCKATLQRIVDLQALAKCAIKSIGATASHRSSPDREARWSCASGSGLLRLNPCRDAGRGRRPESDKCPAVQGRSRSCAQPDHGARAACRLLRGAASSAGARARPCGCLQPNLGPL